MAGMLLVGGVGAGVPDPGGEADQPAVLRANSCLSRLQTHSLATALRGGRIWLEPVVWVQACLILMEKQKARCWV